MRITLPHPYNFVLTMRAAPLYSSRHHMRDGALMHVLTEGKQHALVCARQNEPQAVEITQLAGNLDPGRLMSAAEHWLAIDTDLRSFYAMAQTDEALSRIVDALHGLHILRTSTVFEALTLTIMEQQISLSAAQKAERWLIETYGASVEYGGERHYAFPTPATIAALPAEALSPLKITFIRIHRMLAIARAMVEGALDLEAVRRLPIDAAYARLMALNGVGHWTAAWTLIRARGHFLYVGAADVALRTAVHRYWHQLEGRASRELTDATFAQYGAWAGLASVYTLMYYGLQKYGYRSQ
jgi:DNA-3-methyladenine glycosylase II